MYANLKLKVEAVNAANEYAKQLYPRLVEIFQPLVGQKILKIDGSLLQKYKDLEKSLKLPCTPQISVIRRHNEYTLQWEVKVCKTAPAASGISWHSDDCVYETQNVLIGELKGQELVAIIPPQKLRTDFTVEEIEQKREAFKAAEQALTNARTALYPFDPR